MTEPLHILILEDNPTDAELTQFELSEAGLEFIPKIVTNKKDYVRELQEFSPDLILSDYDLPQFNGILALAEARRNRPDTPFILVTGAVSEDRAIEILTQGAKDYVLKARLQQRIGPAVKRALAEAAELLARRKAEAALRETHKNLERQVSERTAELQRQMEYGKNIEKALLKYNERLEILSYTASRLLASDQPQQLVEELCLQVMEFLDCQTFFNFLVDERAGRLHLNACAGIPPETAREIEWLDFGDAVCGCVAQGGSRIIAENIPETPDVRTELIKSFGIKAYACHPLLEQSRVIGTLSFGTRNHITFDADDLAMMKTVADQVAIAMSRVRSAEKLLQITARFDMAQYAAQVGTWDWDVLTGDILWSDQMFHLFRLDPEEATASFESWKSVLHPEDTETAMIRIDEALRQKTTLNSNYRIVLPDGQIRWINSIGEGKYDPEGRPIQMIGICMDITERKQADESLREAYARTTAILENIADAFFCLDNSWRFVTVNPAAERAPLGKPLRELLGRVIWDVFPGLVGTDIHQHYLDAMTKGRREHFEALSPLNGRWYEVFILPRTAGLDVYLRDIDDRKKMDEALRESEEKYRLLLEHAPAAIYEIDLITNRFITVNDGACRILGYSRDELLAINPMDLIDEESGRLFRERIRQARREQTPLHDFECKAKKKDGSFTWNILHNRFKYEDGKVTGAFVVAQDITERRQVEDELRWKSNNLEAVNRELESFSYSVSHDLRAPLRIIDGYSRILERDYADKLDDKFADTVRVIRSSTRLAGSLIEDLLFLSKVQKTAMRISEIDMDQLAREVWHEIQEAHKERKLNLGMSNIIPGYGDRSLIRQVLFNLLENAVKFTKNRTPDLIEMRSYVDSGHTVYCIRDNGAGFDMEYYEKLFGVFQRLHSSDEYQGTGVGLAIVQRIINRHGGRVWAQGEVDRGAAFYFTLPGKV